MDNEIIENYLHEVCSYIKNKDVHKEIADEIREHIYEIVDEYTNEDLSEDESINKAIKRLGSASECGIKLNKVHRVKPDVISIILALALAVIGIITMYSIEKNNIVEDTSFFNNIRGLIIGGVIATGIYFFDYRKLKRYSYHIYVASMTMLIIVMIKTDHSYITYIGGLYIGQVYIHLIVTTLLLISLSGIIHIKSINNKIDLIIVEVIGIIPLILFFVAQDVTVSLIYLCSINVIFLSSKVKKSLKISLICTEVAFIIPGILELISSPYRMERINTIINPAIDPEGTGYMIMKIRDLLFQSTLFGNEINRATLRIPTIESNFVFAYIIYNFGIVCGVICISLIMAFIVRIFNIISKVKDSYGRTLILSIGSIFFMQVIINMLSNLGITAVFIGLPFICLGSTNSIISISMVGLICSIYRRRGISDIAIVNN